MRVVKTLSSSPANLVRQLRDVSSAGSMWCKWCLGLTRLGDELFVLHDRDDDQVIVYSAETSAGSYKRLRQFSIDGLRGYDMTSCKAHECLYFVGEDSIHKSTTEGDEIAKWPVPGCAGGCLSLTPTNNILITNTSSRVLQEMDSESGTLIRQVALQSDIITPQHALQLADQNYVISRGSWLGGLHRVCVVDVNGQVLLSYGGQRGSSETQLNNPRHIAVDRDNFIFVADRDNHRVVLLSPSLQLVRHIKLTEMPNRLYLDQKTRRLFIGHEGGRVTIIQT